MNGILDANLRALAVKDAGLASRISASKPSPDVSFRISARGATVPVIRGAGRESALHSTVDPAAEGRRLYAEIRDSGFIVFIGMGAGYHILPFLDDPDVCGILVVEKDISFLRAILGNVGMERLLGDPRARFIAEPSPGEIERVMISSYMPALMGSFKSFPIRTMRYPEAFTASVSGEISSALEKIKADFAAQSKFGKRWVSNIVSNLPFAEALCEGPSLKRSVLIAAAGPSLDLQIPLLRDKRTGAMLLSTDTALPALLSHGLRPDAVISIDCQHYSYHHALCARIRRNSLDDIPFLLDISSPPCLVRSVARRIFAAGGHPLAGYIRRNWLGLPEMDTSGGNVAYAAVSAALSAGAEEISLFGLDYSYPDGKPYARGTYLPTLSDSRSSRTAPSESFYASLVFGRGDSLREPIDGGWRYLNPLMRAYHESMQQLVFEAGVAVMVAGGRGLPFRLPAAQPKTGRPLRTWTPSARPKTDWRQFLRDYRNRVASLPLPSKPSELLGNRPDAEKEVWMTLLPLVPGLESENGGINDRSGLLEKARKWTLSRIDRALSS
jgi:hypothetical protein